MAFSQLPVLSATAAPTQSVQWQFQTIQQKTHQKSQGDKLQYPKTNS